MKLIMIVISFWSFREKWDFTSGDKMLCKHYPEINYTKKETSAQANIKEVYN